VQLSLHGERGAMVVDDLRGLPSSPLVVAEGSPLPAWVVSAGLAPRSRALWLVPTRGVQAARLAARATPAADARLYLALGQAIERETIGHGAPILPVDGSLDVAATVQAVQAHLLEALAEGPSSRPVTGRPRRDEALRRLRRRSCAGTPG
jgi:hypothetical protein